MYKIPSINRQPRLLPGFCQNKTPTAIRKCFLQNTVYLTIVKNSLNHQQKNIEKSKKK